MTNQNPVPTHPTSDQALAESFPKLYQPADHEPGIRQRWEASGAFHPDPKQADGREPFCIVIPPPNVTDQLHLGHALNNTLQDVLIRAHRMMGDLTLWLPGTDHAGIATQTKVEKQILATEGRRRTDFPRDEFVGRIRAWKDEFEARITEQLKAMGCSCDWDRQRFTMDEGYAAAVREAFFRLFKDGMIYRSKRLVNWDPVTQTALADDEVEMEEVDGSFWYMRYPLAWPLDPSRGSVPVTWSDLAARGFPGANEHPDEERAWVTVATTRPETYLGDTAVAVNPKDPRAIALRGLFVELPLVGRMIPIIEDDYVILPAVHGGDTDDPKSAYTTGFLKVTPAHDRNDEEIGKRHHADILERCSAHKVAINVMAPDASISDQYGWEDVGDARLFLGKDRYEAREMVAKEFYDRGWLEDVKPYRHSVGHSYRSHAPIEDYQTDQWYVRVTDERLRGEALHAMPRRQRTTDSFLPRKGNRHDGRVRIHPERYARTYETWHENLRDWCISRQLWWGHRIPVWSISRYMTPSDSIVSTQYQVPYPWKVKTREEGACYKKQFDAFAEQDRLAVRFRAAKNVSDTNAWDASPIDPGNLDWGEATVCVSHADDTEVIAFLESYGFERDPDVLDTWFSSALWPIATMGWPSETDLLNTFNPSNVLTTARDIITLWVSRMVMFNRYFRKDGDGNGVIPFTDVYIHAMIQDGSGQRMSKSLGNGVDPLDIIHSHGADAMRYTLCQMSTQTQDVRMPVEQDPETGRNTSPKFDSGRNFCNKLWNAARFAHSILSTPDGSPQPVSPSSLGLVDRWMLSRLAGAVEQVNAAVGEFQFSAYAQALYDLLWRDLCDWYLEAIKPTAKDNPAQRAVLGGVLDAILRLLHPISPFITEAIHERMADVPTGSIEGLTLAPPSADGLLCSAGWPEVDPSLRDDAIEARFERVRTLVSAIREVRSQHQVKPKRRVVLHCPNDKQLKAVASAEGLVEHLAGLVRATTDEPASAAVAFTVDSVEYRLSELADAVDAGAERARLEKQITELDKSIRTLEGRLNNPGYTEKAPPHMVQQTRDQLQDKIRERQAAATALEQLR